MTLRKSKGLDVLALIFIIRSISKKLLIDNFRDKNYLHHLASLLLSHRRRYDSFVNWSLQILEGYKFISFFITVTCLPSLNKSVTSPYLTFLCYSKDTATLPQKGDVLQIDNSAVDEMLSETEVSWTSSSLRDTTVVKKEKKRTTKTESTELENETFTTFPHEALQTSKTMSFALQTEWEVIAFYSNQRTWLDALFIPG